MIHFESLSYGLSYGLMHIWNVFSGIPLKVEDAGAGESAKDIAKLINAEHSRAYGPALRAAKNMGESEARQFSILRVLDMC